MTTEKQGAIIGGWVCLVIATGMFVFHLSPYLYFPVFLAGFVLGIVGIAQRSLLNGIPIMLLSVVVPFAGEEIYKSTKKDKQFVPQDSKHFRPLIVAECRNCHAPDKSAPLSSRHPLKEQCMICHRDK